MIIRARGRWPGRALAPSSSPRYGPAAVRSSRNTLVGIYYLGVLAMIAVGATLWLTGHGTGDPWLSLGVALAFAPPVVIWVRRLFSRD